MRKIEQQMNAAIRAGKDWTGGNTKVIQESMGAIVLLHGNLIAIVKQTGETVTVLETLRQWNTPTTKSRLRALGVNVQTRKGRTYVDGQEI